MAGLLAGAVAVFESENQAGTVALLAVGSVASLLAVVGKVPLRWVIGGHEFDMSETAAREAADALASSLGPAETEALADRLADIEQGGASPITNAMRDHVNFERTAIGRVTQVVTKAGFTYTDVSQTRDVGFDGMIQAPDRTQVLVEYKLVRPEMLMRRIRDLRERLIHKAASDLVLVVSGAPIDRRARLQQPDGPCVHVVFLDDPNFDRELLAAVEAALHRVRASG